MLKYFRDRRGVGWLLGSFLLMLVIIAFVALYVPDFMAPDTGLSATGNVAWVNGAPISMREFNIGYQQMSNQYRQQLGDQYSPDLLQQFGLDRMVVQQLVQDKVLEIEAQRLGLAVTDDEVSRDILNNPSLQRDGQFIGKDAYLALLQSNGISPATFEEELRLGLLRRKLQELVTDGVVVTDDELKEQFRNRNESAHLEYTIVPKAEFEGDFAPSPEDVEAYYEANKSSFERPVQRKASFITLTPTTFSSTVTVTDREIQRYYDENIVSFSTEEQVSARHILFKTGPDADVEAVRAQAEAVLAEIQTGGDFGELAQQHSEDTSAERGGDLGTFGRGQMVPEFEQSAFSLPIGGTSDLVRTTYGFHIINVTNKQQGLTQPLESVQEQIRGTLTQEKASTRMEAAISSASEKLRAAGAIDALTAEYPLLVAQETDFFGQNDPVPQLSNSTEASRLVFEASLHGITPAIPLGFGGGYAFLQVIAEREAGPAPLEEVRAQAEARMRDEHTLALAKEKAIALRETLVTSGATAAGIELATTETFFRDSQIPEAGRSVAVGAKAFTLPDGEFSEPLPAANGYVVLRVVETSGYDETSFAEQRAGFEEQILGERRSRLWGAFVGDLQSKYEVQVDWQTIRSVLG